MNIRPLLLLALFIWTNSPLSGQGSNGFSAKGFKLRSGVNIFGWLSQSKFRGADRASFFTESDVRWIAKQGFDHIRLPVDEEQLWDEKGKREKEAFDLLRQAVGWSVKHKLRIIVDLHILRSHYFDAKENKLWTDSLAQQQFVKCWLDLSDALKSFPRDKVAYELMNEPVATNCEDWNKVLRKVAAAIRRKEPKRILVIGSNLWQQPMTFACLKPPAKDPNIILSFHFYSPMILTHYKASWVNTGKYEGVVQYPGRVVSDEELNKLDFEFSKLVESRAGQWSKSEMETEVQKAVRESKKLGYPLYCGEFGCLKTAPSADRLRWFSDATDVFRSQGIGYTVWCYKERKENGFALRIINSEKEDADLMKVLLKK
jgi:endoglucanase